ncbi:MAG: transposase, partial [candidate division NC10 bacterium]|nr:transposase [candidate division NC10 bacterium]
MLRDRYDPMNVFDYVPALMPTTDPVLAQIDPLLADDAVVQAVRADLAQHRPQTVTTGRPSTPVEVILRLLAVKRLYGWRSRETERRVSDSLI